MRAIAIGAFRVVGAVYSVWAGVVRDLVSAVVASGCSIASSWDAVALAAWVVLLYSWVLSYFSRIFTSAKQAEGLYCLLVRYDPCSESDCVWAVAGTI
jgi:hypothetical protein